MIETLLASKAGQQFMGNLGAGLGQGLGDALGGGAGGPMQSGSGVFDLRSAMDGSGWTVSTGKSSATSDIRRTADNSAASGLVPSQAGGNWLGLALMLGLALAFIKRGKL